MGRPATQLEAEMAGEIARLQNELHDVRSIAAPASNSARQSVYYERMKQDLKWGEQNHNPYIYLAILLEEVGELAQSLLQSQFGGEHGGRANVRKEAVHTAAVALAIVECLDRDKWQDGDVCLKAALSAKEPTP